MSKREEVERINIIRGKRRLVLEAIDRDLDELVHNYLREYATREAIEVSPSEFMDEFDKFLDVAIEAHDKLCEIVQDYYHEQLYGDEDVEDDE